MIRTAFSTLGCPDWDWFTLLKQGPACGYDGVEIRLIARQTNLLALPELQPHLLSRRRRELADAGFAVCGLGSSVRFDYPETENRIEQVDIGRAYLDLAAGLGAEFVRVFGDVVPRDHRSRETILKQIAEGWQTLGEYAQTLNLHVLVETHGDFSDSKLLAEAMQHISSPAVGVLWDTHHPWRFYHEPLHETCDRLRPWLRHTHWKDSISTARPRPADSIEQAAEDAHTLMSGHRHANYVLFGGGEFPALQCARLLRQAGYSGWCTLEWEVMWHPELEPPELAFPLFPQKIRELWELAGI